MFMNYQGEIDHEYTDEIVCPFCGCKFSDSWEYGDGIESTELIECHDCYKEFYATRNVTIDYSTEKAKYGVCKHCNKDDVVIESYHSTLGKYEDLCSKCGVAERARLMKVYFEELDSIAERK